MAVAAAVVARKWRRVIVRLGMMQSSQGFPARTPPVLLRP
jgi:hypothetical protein